MILSYWLYRLALTGELIWDDREALFNHPVIISPFSSLARIWFTRQAPDFWPLHYSWFFLTWRLWGSWTLPYHLVNVLLHALNTTFCAMILSRLKARSARFAALIFCVHPVNVEAVAWIVQFKTLASTALCCGSWLMFLSFSESQLPRKRAFFYLSSLFFFTAALLTKSAVVFAPFIILAFGLHRSRNFGRAVLWVIPFFILSLASGLVSLSWYRPNELLPLGESLDLGPWYERLARAGICLLFYLEKALWPANLAFIYPRLRVTPLSLDSYLPGFFIALIFLIAWMGRKFWGKAVPAALGYYALALSPALGLVGIYFMRYADVADHWQYMALIAPVYLVVRFGAQLPISKPAKMIAALFILSYCMYLTKSHVTLFQNEQILWQKTLEKNPSSWLAHNNLGRELLDHGQFPAAEAHFSEALRLKPDFSDAVNNLGAVYLAGHQLPKAMDVLANAVKLWPENAAAQSNYGIALTRAGRLEEAVTHLTLATKLAPEDASYHKNLGFTLHRLGNLSLARDSYRQAARIAPSADHLSDFGQILRESGLLEEAKTILQQALVQKADHGLAMANLGLVYMAEGNLLKGCEELKHAGALSERSAAIHLALADCLLKMQQVTAAKAELEQALKIDPLASGSREIADQIKKAMIRQP